MIEEQGELATQSTQQDEPQDLRSVLESAMDKQTEPTPDPGSVEDKPTRSRDEAGRFTPAELAQQAADKAAAVDQPALEAKRAPSSWKKDAAAEFDKLPPHVQDEVLRRETDFHKGIEGFKQHADLGRSMERALQPYMQTIQQLGVAPDQAVGALLKADAMLRNPDPAQRAQYFATLAQQYGIDLGQAAQVPQRDPYTFQLEQQLQQIRQQQEQFQQSQQEQQREALNSELQAFAATAEHFEAVKEDMAALLQAGRATDLKDAYDKAVYANPQTRQALLEQQRQEALKQAQTQALNARAKAAAVSVKGSSPASGNGAAPTNLRAALESAWNS
ncbi:hypothetical protein [Hydrogenophaga sp.]|uniref:hypothetical protein n=1 Tax=Hydrogenophaga sp. TaxID=1904254 RepID=UPI002722E690|nr:hypothetical protein [Hydrogenophaga sp.]MDO9131975.1 hypothetical protein [Hydrogenophaga sp.]